MAQDRVAGRRLAWPEARGAVIGVFAGLLVAGSPILGAVVVLGEAWWIRSLRREGVRAQDVRTVAWSAVVGGVSTFVLLAALFAGSRVG